MNVFVTGGSGFIGSATIPELLRAGHRVNALARSDASARALEAMGATVRRGSLEDIDVLRAGAADAEGVIHLGFIHDFSRFGEVAQIDQLAIETMGAVLEGTGRPLVIASGLFGLAMGRPANEDDRVMLDASVMPRRLGADAATALAERGVRTSIVRLAPTVHGAGDHGFIPTIIAIARERGISGYVGDGENRWPAVHRLDAAVLFRLALERAPAGAALHGVDDVGVPTRTIAEIIGMHLDLPVRSIAPEKAGEHFGWMGRFFGADLSATSTITRETLGWTPTHPGLIADLEAGYYFESARAHA
jgi:nucleoside-diphosphate-sugar epimerase